ncbi:MAG: Spore coat assembly protein ExsA [Pelotomaculum sp. PtaB.Bin104]|nr:MAG: Spore coat assembly protein ExsA [Pelotomaculum sp. PtaB.Bin104]
MTYSVQAGETLFTIAKKFSITLDTLFAANPQIENPDLILPGQVINIPIQVEEPAPAPAPPGGGYEKEPGIPGKKPLHVVDVTWDGKGKKGSNVIPKKPTLTIQFDKNVVNDTVWENNRKSISLLSRSKKIPIYITRIRDTVDFSMRNNIFVQPVNPLSPGTAYTLRVSPKLKSKTGVTLGSSTDGYGYSIELRTER